MAAPPASDTTMTGRAQQTSVEADEKSDSSASQPWVLGLVTGDACYAVTSICDAAAYNVVAKFFAGVKIKRHRLGGQVYAHITDGSIFTKYFFHRLGTIITNKTVEPNHHMLPAVARHGAAGRKKKADDRSNNNLFHVSIPFLKSDVEGQQGVTVKAYPGLGQHGSLEQADQWCDTPRIVPFWFMVDLHHDPGV